MDSLRRGTTFGPGIALFVGAIFLIAIGFVIGRGTAPSAPTPPLPEGGASAVGSPDEERGSAGVNAGAVRPAVDPALMAVLDPEAPFRFEPPYMNFGVVPPDHPLSDMVTIRNVSDEPLEIMAMKPTCTCTTLTDLTGYVIQPGESTELEIQVDGETYTGPKRSSINFVFGGYGEVTYTIRSMISRTVHVQPTNLTVDTQYRGVIEVETLEDRAFRVLAVNGQTPVFADRFDPTTDEPRKRYLLAWDLTDYDPVECTNADGEAMPPWWVIETDHPGSEIVELRVRHAPCTLPEGMGVGQRWIMSTRRAVLPVLKPGETTELVLYMSWPGDKVGDDTIQRVEAETEAFHAVLRLPLEREGDRIKCTVRITPKPGTEGLFQGVLRFHSYAEGHTWPIHVIGTVRGEAE